MNQPYRSRNIVKLYSRGYLLLICLLFLISCQPEFKKFDPPEWIEGKLFEQIQSIPGTDSFEVCLKRTGYDTILNSANFTVFVPENEAFQEYLTQHLIYASIRDIPFGELVNLLKSHIIQNPWSRDQLKSANEEGWINKRDPDQDDPWGYKRQTLFKEKNCTYWITPDPLGGLNIVDSAIATENRPVFQPTRKYVPFFFDEYLDLAEISPEDFEYYFDRPYEYGYMYFAGARLDPEDHFAENGFIFLIDRVVPPLKNVEQLLEGDDEEDKYSMFRELIYLFPSFHENLEQTNLQPGFEEGLEVPTLYDLDYPDLAFDIHEEITGRRSYTELTTTRYHNGILAPTNDAMQELIDNVITIQSGDSTRWASFRDVPKYLKRIIVNSHMSKSPIHLSDLKQGFPNEEWDTLKVNPASVIEKEYGSNATFLGIDRAIVPRVFSSVTAPVYLRPQYVGFMNGLELSGLTPALKRRNASYIFYVVQVGEDYFEGWDQSSIINRFLNQIGTQIPKEQARKEFIPTMGGNFIVYDTTRRPQQLREPTDNGISVAANSFNSANLKNLYWTLYQRYRGFFNLMERAGQLDSNWGRITFLNETEFHTIFAPSDEALSNINTDTMDNEELTQFIRYHFINGALIFTDGNKEPGSYNTLRVDESSTLYDTHFSTLDIRPEPDKISIYDQDGRHITDVLENGWHTNVMIGGRRSDYQTNGVIHKLDTVFLRR